MRIDHNGRPSLRKPTGPRANPSGGTNRLGDEMRVVPKDFIDPIEYAQKAMQHEYAVRRAEITRRQENGS